MTTLHCKQCHALIAGTIEYGASDWIVRCAECNARNRVNLILNSRMAEEWADRNRPAKFNSHNQDQTVSAETLTAAALHHVLFFADNSKSHPHEADIRVLLKTCSDRE